MKSKFKPGDKVIIGVHAKLYAGGGSVPAGTVGYIGKTDVPCVWTNEGEPETFCCVDVTDTYEKRPSVLTRCAVFDKYLKKC